MNEVAVRGAGFVGSDRNPGNLLLTLSLMDKPPTFACTPGDTAFENIDDEERVPPRKL